MADINVHPCQCNIITDLLNDPDVSLSVDADGIFSLIDHQVRYYCWKCGGCVTNIWNSRMSDEERERLQQIVDSISSAEEALMQLGPADYDVFMSHWDSIDGRLVYNEELSRHTRNMEYYHISECANIEFYFSENSKEARIMLKFTEEDQRQFNSSDPYPEPYCDGTDNGNKPIQVTTYEINWVKCPNCGWRFCLDYATQSGEWPVHPKCGQRLDVKTP